jgi:iron transport multicopper oxidase
VFTVTAGKRYRYRLISTAPRAVMPFSVDGHNLTVIEVDGNAIRPVATESVELYRQCLSSY